LFVALFVQRRKKLCQNFFILATPLTQKSPNPLSFLLIY
jgi:hypothetical protein